LRAGIVKCILSARQLTKKNTRDKSLGWANHQIICVIQKEALYN
jgi:hypothetical protein